MSSPDPETRTLVAQIAANSSWSQTPDRAQRTAKARAAAFARFEEQVDPERTLPAAERAKRAANARAAHLARISLRANQARKAAKAAATELAATAAELDALNDPDEA